MARKRTYKILLSDDDKKILNATIHNKKKGGIPAIIKINRNPRSNARRKLDGRMEAEILRIACGPAPDGRARWTLRLLEKQVRLEFDEPIGRESIRLALKKMNFDLT